MPDAGIDAEINSHCKPWEQPDILGRNYLCAGATRLSSNNILAELNFLYQLPAYPTRSKPFGV